MTKKILVPVVIVVISVALGVWLAMQGETPRTTETVLPTMLVDVVRAHASTEKITVSAQGTVVPRTQTTIVSEVSGLITRVAPVYVAGGIFSKGDVLVSIDDRNYRAEVKRAEAAVAAAQTNVTRETGLSDYAREDWERAQSVLRSSKAATELALRTPQVAEALASLEYALADLEKRQGDLDRTVIKAPYDGMVREKIADLGQFVNAGSPLATTFSIDVAEVRLPLPDKELPFLNLDDTLLKNGNGPEAQFSARLGGRLHHWSGGIVRTEGVFDERSRVLYVVAQVEDPYNQHTARWPYPLRIGTFVKAQIEGESLNDVIRLPRSVLKGNNRVWTVSSDNTLQPSVVEVVRADEQSILVTAGLVDGQLVCTSILENPLPGTPVRFDQPANTELGVNFGID